MGNAKNTTICDIPRFKYMAVNPRYPKSRVKSYTVNIRYTMCRVCESMRHVVDFRRETVVLQESTIFTHMGQIQLNIDKILFTHFTYEENA